jgi:hypothetical protein
MLYSYFRVLPQRQNFTCRRFGALSVPYLGNFLLTPPMKMEMTKCSETSVNKILTRKAP